MTHLCVVQVRATGVGHVMRRDTEHVHDETSGIGPGLSGRRDGVGTGRGTSHNSDISYEYIPTRNNLANCLTKPLTRPQFQDLTACMGMSSELPI